MMGKRPKHTKRNKRILRSAGAALLLAAVGGGGVASAFPGPYHAPYAANPIGAIHLLSGEEKRIDLTGVFADLDGDIDWGSFAVEGGGSMAGVDQKTDPAHPQLVLRAPYEGIDAVRLWLRGRDKAGHEAAEEIYVGYGELTAKPGADVLGFPADGMAPYRVEMSSLFQSLAGPGITLTAVDGETVTRATYYELAPSGTAGFRKVTLTAADSLDREAVVELTARFGSAPSAAGSIPDQLIGEQGVTLPLSEWFTDADLADPALEDRLTYSAELVGREEDLYGYKPVPVQLEVNGETGQLEMNGRFPGTSLVRVTATDRAGWSASLLFTATVPPLTVYRGIGWSLPSCPWEPSMLFPMTRWRTPL
ncbi:hypothetical protein N6H14_07910 [Paenibacillus sp. CC-CFT747]|nr:hypothetical protein N6H14_07910 [Paenibacillus sp. CC-CFT747]